MIYTEQKTALNSHKKVSENKDFRNIVISSQDTKILESDKVSFVIYADRECLIKKIDGCKNNPDITFPINIP